MKEERFFFLQASRNHWFALAKHQLTAKPEGAWRRTLAHLEIKILYRPFNSFSLWGHKGLTSRIDHFSKHSLQEKGEESHFWRAHRQVRLGSGMYANRRLHPRCWRQRRVPFDPHLSSLHCASWAAANPLRLQLSARLKVKESNTVRKLLLDRNFNVLWDESLFATTFLAAHAATCPQKRRKMFTFVARWRRAINGSSLNSETEEKRRWIFAAAACLRVFFFFYFVVFQPTAFYWLSSATVRHLRGDRRGGGGRRWQEGGGMEKGRKGGVKAEEVVPARQPSIDGYRSRRSAPETSQRQWEGGRVGGVVHCWGGESKSLCLYFHPSSSKPRPRDHTQAARRRPHFFYYYYFVSIAMLLVFVKLITVWHSASKGIKKQQTTTKALTQTHQQPGIY